MPVSNALLGSGSAIYVNTSVTAAPGDNALNDWAGVGGTWTLLFTGPTELNLPGAEPTRVEITSLLSPERKREFLAGPIDQGQVQGTAYMEATEYVANMARVGIKYGYRIVTVEEGTADQETPVPDLFCFFMGTLGLSPTTLTFGEPRTTPFSISIDSAAVFDETPAAGDV